MWYWAFRALFKLTLKYCFAFKVEGIENLPLKTNFIVVANHASWLDPVIVGVAIPKKINYIAVRGLYKINWLRWFVRLMQALPTGSASEKAIEFLSKNKVIGLFPEGGCSRDGKLREFRRGAALLGLKTGRPIVPCAVLGSYKALPARAKFPKFVPIKVKIGRPIYLLKELDELIDDIRLQQGTFEIKNTIQEMLDAG